MAQTASFSGAFLQHFPTILRLLRVGRPTAAHFHCSAVSSSRIMRRIERRPETATSADTKRPACKIEDLVTPVAVMIPREANAVLSDTNKKLDYYCMSLALDEFSRRKEVRDLAAEFGITDKLFFAAFKSFRVYCLSAKPLDPIIAVCFSDIATGGHSVDQLFASFHDHAKKVFPHLEAMEDLRLISDLTQPQSWYPEARMLHRRVIFHAGKVEFSKTRAVSGPTNSGKTYAALQRLYKAKSAMYCGPLKLLAYEVFGKITAEGIPCDLATGDERRYAIDRDHPSRHIASTVEMMSTTTHVEVGIIDEIQMLRDEQRGWAWTRALYGCSADELHLCGESAAVDMVRKLLDPIGEHLEVIEYERKSPLMVSSKALESLENVEDGDCIVCFSRRRIFAIAHQLENLGYIPAVIYGDLPPGTKLAQAAKFNDPDDRTNVLVATDAIGMGMNLTIKRIIFNSIHRVAYNGDIPNYMALQIAGRAGRFGSRFPEGLVTTLHSTDLIRLKKILSEPVEPIAQVGIAPTFEQLETFSYHLPGMSFIGLIDVFVDLCSISDQFFLCKVEEMKALAILIEAIPLPLKVRYTFCVAPVKMENVRLTTAFVKFARRFSTGQIMDREFLAALLSWPIRPVQMLTDLLQLEEKYEIIEIYLWFSLRFPDMFTDGEEVRLMRDETDAMIADGIDRINEILAKSTDAKLASIAKKAMEKERTAEQKAQLEAEILAESETAVDEKFITATVAEPSQPAAGETIAAIYGNNTAIEPKEPTVSRLKLPFKRKGKRLSVLDQLIEKGAISKRDARLLTFELRGGTKKPKEGGDFRTKDV